MAGRSLPSAGLRCAIGSDSGSSGAQGRERVEIVFGFKMVQCAKICQTSRVTESKDPQQNPPGSRAADIAPETPRPAVVPAPRPREIGGREGPDPTRYGDWEKGGRCIDF
jgi:hypothetical protein